MQLYKRISELNYDSIDQINLIRLLRTLGVDDKFVFINRGDFTKFIFYFVHAYSFESTMMDTKCFTKSLAIIEENFKFSFTEFRELQDYKDFDNEYQELIQWYLEVQKNRDFELLMSGHILYKQMISASTSRTILKKSKDENEGTENIDYDLKHKIYMNCLSLNSELSKLEDKLSSANSLISAVDVNTTKRLINLRIEEK